MQPLRIAVVAGAPLLQAGLGRVVEGTPGLELVALAVSINALRVTLVQQAALQVDVAIVDASAADEPTAISAALDAGMHLVLLSDAEPAQLAPLIAAGAACLPTAAADREIAAAVSAVAAGLVAMRSDLFGEVMRKTGANERRPAELVEPLTPRELQVLRLLAGGFANKHIANDLGISEHTAKFHVGRILGKLDAATRAEAVAIGLRDGLIAIGAE